MNSAEMKPVFYRSDNFAPNSSYYLSLPNWGKYRSMFTVWSQPFPGGQLSKKMPNFKYFSKFRNLSEVLGVNENVGGGNKRAVGGMLMV